jgi:hypothetical protein
LLASPICVSYLSFLRSVGKVCSQVSLPGGGSHPRTSRPIAPGWGPLPADGGIAYVGSSSSYQDALLGRAEGTDSAVGQATSVTADLKEKQLKGRQQSKKAHLQASVQLPATTDADEGWQVVGLRRRHARHHVPLLATKPPSLRYLTIVVGRCLNCLSRSHRVATYCLPTHCFSCHGFRHHLWDCKHPRKPPAQQAFNCFVSSTNVVGHFVVRARCDGFIISHGSRWTRTTSIGTCASKQPKVLEPLLMELQLDRESLGDT